MTPEQIKLLVMAAIAAALIAVGWTLNGWRLSGEIEQLHGEKKVLEDQVKVLGEATRACSASVEQGRQLGDQVVGEIRGQLKLFASQNAGNAATVARIEDLLKQPTPPGAGCDAAWDKIEADRKARAP